MRGFVREELVRWMVRWDSRGDGVWRANPKKLVDGVLKSLSGARVPKAEKEEVSRSVQGLIRHKLLLDALQERPVGAADRRAATEAVASATGGSPPERRWDRSLALLASEDLAARRRCEDLPAHVRVSFPRELLARLAERYGGDVTEVCEVSNDLPQTFLRANPALAPCRGALLDTLRQRGLDAEPAKDAPLGIRVVGEHAAKVTQLGEYFDGIFEIQDESSQLIAELVQCAPGDVVVDLCSGAAGKALAVLPRLGASGALVLHDVRASSLRAAEDRLRRASAGGAATAVEAAAPRCHVERSAAKLRQRWAGWADWVLVDAPCSNSGSLRRHPECKYRLFEDADAPGLAELVVVQQVLLRQAKELLRDGGAIVYSTCSLLLEENEAQVDWAAQELGLRPAAGAAAAGGFVGCFPPLRAGRDGFFAAVLR